MIIPNLLCSSKDLSLDGSEEKLRVFVLFLQEQQCQTVNEQQCRTVTDTSYENECTTVQEEKCEIQYMTKYEQQCSSTSENVRQQYF